MNKPSFFGQVVRIIGVLIILAGLAVAIYLQFKQNSFWLAH